MKLNAHAVVPTLVDDGVVIIESTVICEYLDDAYSEPNLRPRNRAAGVESRYFVGATERLDQLLRDMEEALRTFEPQVSSTTQRLLSHEQLLELCRLRWRLDIPCAA